MRVLIALPLFFALVFVSCGTRQEEPHQARATLKPNVLDFGRVRATEKPLVLDFYVENKSSQRLPIDKVLPSCGCTLCDLPSDTIPSKGSIAICVKVFLAGHSGEFEQDVIIKIVGEKDSLILPIKGYIADDLSFSGQTIRCTADQTTRVAETHFDLTVRKLSDIDFDTDSLPAGVTIGEIARETTQDGFVLRMSLRIQVPTDRNSYYFDLVLQPKSVDILPLVIPVQCFVAE